MKEIYNLQVSWMNGTVVAYTDVSSYSTEMMAKEVEKKVIERNKDSEFPVITEIKVGYLYETLSEVPIMNEEYKKECR